MFFFYFFFSVAYAHPECLCTLPHPPPCSIFHLTLTIELLKRDAVVDIPEIGAASAPAPASAAAVEFVPKHFRKRQSVEC